MGAQEATMLSYSKEGRSEWQSLLLALARSLDRMSVSAGRLYPMPYLQIFLSEQYLRDQYFIKILDIDI